MSRSLIGGIVAIVIAALTATAYFVTTSSLEDKLRADARRRVQRGLSLLQRDSQLEGLSVQAKAEFFAADPKVLAAIKADNGGDRSRESNRAFTRFRDEQGTPPPDILAVVDASGALIAMDGVPNPVPNAWKTAGAKEADMIWPGVELALKTRISISEIWNVSGKGLMRVGIAPVIDPEATVPAGDEDGVIIVGAAVTAYSLTSKAAMAQSDMLGADVAYFEVDRVYATSFRRGSDEDTGMQNALTAALAKSGLDKPGTGVHTVDLGDYSYYATSGRLSRFSSKELPKNYPPATAGAIVLASPEKDPSRDAIKTIKLLILILGAGSLGIALFGLHLSSRRFLVQVDSIELGVADIINGNLDRTFRPVGEELDGLANGLNVMLARLLGRPEPGEEEFDENGNPIVPGRVEFEEAEEGGQAPAPDPELAALAQEPEPDYYKRIFTEYLDARRKTGNPDEVSFENFIAKLKVNEGKLKAQYNCSRVRFRVVVKDGKVTLKPVPIYA